MRNLIWQVLGFEHTFNKKTASRGPGRWTPDRDFALSAAMARPIAASPKGRWWEERLNTHTTTLGTVRMHDQLLKVLVPVQIAAPFFFFPPVRFLLTLDYTLNSTISKWRILTYTLEWAEVGTALAIKGLHFGSFTSKVWILPAKIWQFQGITTCATVANAYQMITNLIVAAFSYSLIFQGLVFLATTLSFRMFWITCMAGGLANGM